MHYIWKNRLWDKKGLITTDGDSVEVIDTGLLNTDAGPDFFNAKVRIGDKLWVGNVEMHLKASDWHLHHHDSDKAYDTVILHVVNESDTIITRSSGDTIPQCLLALPPKFEATLECLTNSLANGNLACASHLTEMPSLIITNWLETLAVERLYAKSVHLKEIFNLTGCNREQTCYIAIARSLGFGLNSDAFEILARSTPLQILGKHSDNMLQLEALLFGQAGMLGDANQMERDEYYAHLSREYTFLANKFSLTANDGTMWKRFRIRPQNFPHRRIAILAALAHGGFSLLRNILECNTVDELREVFCNTQVSPYWSVHYSFGGSAKSTPKVLGKTAADILIINAVAPLLHTFGMENNSPELIEKAVTLLENLSAEQNHITKLFVKYGISNDNAMRSQALIHLYRNYCEQKKCIYCHFGHRILKKQ